MNNEQVIKYVSENSKNPHAAMIVEWLLTGCKVEFLSSGGDWRRTDRYPRWKPDVKHRLVKPKMRHAYRVYRFKDEIYPHMQFRDDQGNITHDPAGKIILQDWTEYDPEPKKWPTPLVERIAAIDIKAAEWIVEHWDELLEDKYTFNGRHSRHSRDSNKIKEMFNWAVTPQGGDYWVEIYKKLGE